MRKAVIGVILVTGLLAGSWIFAENRAVERVRALIEADQGIQATGIRPLRDPRQLGVHLSQPQLSRPDLQLSLPWAQLSMAPLSPTTARLELPDTASLVSAGRRLELGQRLSEASLRLAPLHRLAPARLVLSTHDLTLNGQPLADRLDLRAALGRLQNDAPRAAGAAYDLQLDLQGVQPSALALAGVDTGPVPGPLAARGVVRLWLDDVPTADQPRPAIIGWQTEALTLDAGPVQLRVAGRLTRGTDGRAEGQLALYSADADQMLEMASEIGLIPSQARLLLRAGLSQLGQVPPATDIPGPDFPEPAPGELRLAVMMRDGQLMVAGVPVGPAPVFLP